MKPSIPAAWSVSNMPKPQAQAAAQSSPGGSSGQREPLSRSVPSFSHLGARARATSQQPQSASRAVALSRVERRGRLQAEPSIVLRGDPSCRYMSPFFIPDKKKKWRCSSGGSLYRQMPHHIFVPDDIVDVLPAETDQIGEPIASGLDTNPVVVYASSQPLVPRANEL